MSSQYSPLSISITKKLDKTIKKQEGIYFTPPKTIENNIKLLSPYIDNIKNIYRKNEKYLENYEKAKGIDFWLGLKSSKKYSPEQWVLFINNPNEFCK